MPEEETRRGEISSWLGDDQNTARQTSDPGLDLKEGLDWWPSEVPFNPSHSGVRERVQLNPNLESRLGSRAHRKHQMDLELCQKKTHKSQFSFFPIPTTPFKI